jgi:RsiW-degrading membrane proteinase PrsW (M82 family)
MPTIPMIVPLLVTGVLFGYILRTKKTNVGRKLTALGCLLGGVGNAVNGAILYLFQSQATTGPSIPSFARQTAPTQSPVSFLILSFVVGALIVLLVLVPAVLVQRRTFPHLPFRRRQQ